LFLEVPVDPNPGGEAAHADDGERSSEEDDFLGSVEGDIHRRRILMLPRPDSRVMFRRSAAEL
jgi:hypothetical protein